MSSEAETQQQPQQQAQPPQPAEAESPSSPAATATAGEKKVIGGYAGMVSFVCLYRLLSLLFEKFPELHVSYHAQLSCLPSYSFAPIRLMDLICQTLCVKRSRGSAGEEREGSKATLSTAERRASWRPGDHWLAPVLRIPSDRSSGSVAEMDRSGGSSQGARGREERRRGLLSVPGGVRAVRCLAPNEMGGD